MNNLQLEISIAEFGCVVAPEFRPDFQGRRPDKQSILRRVSDAIFFQ
jgi:hypothetical protein